MYGVQACIQAGWGAGSQRASVLRFLQHLISACFCYSAAALKVLWHSMHAIQCLSQACQPFGALSVKLLPTRSINDSILA
jgi:hypothetical protein